MRPLCSALCMHWYTFPHLLLLNSFIIPFLPGISRDCKHWFHPRLGWLVMFIFLLNLELARFYLVYFSSLLLISPRALEVTLLVHLCWERGRYFCSTTGGFICEDFFRGHVLISILKSRGVKGNYRSPNDYFSWKETWSYWLTMYIDIPEQKNRGGQITSTALAHIGNVFQSMT